MWVFCCRKVEKDNTLHKQSNKRLYDRTFTRQMCTYKRTWSIYRSDTSVRKGIIDIDDQYKGVGVFSRVKKRVKENRNLITINPDLKLNITQYWVLTSPRWRDSLDFKPNLNAATMTVYGYWSTTLLS